MLRKRFKKSPIENYFVVVEVVLLFCCADFVKYFFGLVGRLVGWGNFQKSPRESHPIRKRTRYKYAQASTFTQRTRKSCIDIVLQGSRVKWVKRV